MRKLPITSRIACAGAVAAAVALGTALSAGAAFADTDTVINASLLDASTPGLHTDYVDNDASLASTESASAFDLRHYGGTVTFNEGDTQSTITGGVNYVTPIKRQTPYGSCWAFSVTAAAETSMITSLDKLDGDGTLDGTITYGIAAASGTDTLAYAAANLSERHLAYFAFAHPSNTGIYASQAGEGKYLINDSTDASSIIDLGGLQMLGLSTYTSGIGPVPESYAPYISDEGWIEVIAPLGDGSYGYQYFTSNDDAQAFYLETWTDDAVKKFNEYEQAQYAKQKRTWNDVTAAALRPTISSRGTWAVDQEKMYGVVAELDNSNIISSTHDPETGILSDAEMSQMKSELAAGHPLSIAICADESQPGQQVNGKRTYMNYKTWSHYTYESTGISHAVTIVGYDDNYSKDHFTHKIYNADGSVNDEETAKTTPTGDGAWIVKNSWGSTNNKNPLYERDWGVDGSGYFYLSYYDKSVCSIESYEFDVSEEAQERTQYVSYQHDLANVSQTKSTASEELIQMCNVFDGPNEGEKTTAIRDLGYLSGSAGATTTLAVYVMDDDEDTATVIAKGKPAATATDSSHATAGYHRVHLSNPVVVNPGQKFAVVQTTQRTNGDYEYTYGRGLSRTYQKALLKFLKATDQPTTSAQEYTYTVINQGESLIFYDDAWQDWKDVSAAIDQQDAATTMANVQNEAIQLRAKAALLSQQAEQATDPEVKAALEEQAATALTQAEADENFYVDSIYAIDNWMLKAYGDEVEDVIEVFSDVEAGAWYVPAIQNAYNLGLMSGYKDADGNPTGVFGTEDNLTRAQAVAVLYRMVKANPVDIASPFSDVADDAWYAEAVKWAVQNGVVSGYDNGRFGPNDQVTREQLATMLYRMAQKDLIDVPTTINENALEGYSDAASVSSYATETMKWAVTQGIIHGTSATTLTPAGYSSRAVMAQMIYNLP